MRELIDRMGLMRDGIERSLVVTQENIDAKEAEIEHLRDLRRRDTLLVAQIDSAIKALREVSE